MSVEYDFLALYRQLGVGPDHGLAAFRQAYRRHVAAWHPDRAATPDVERLQRLTAQYNAAMEFHRLHGRLPGAGVVPASRRAGQPRGAIVPLPPAAGAPRAWWLLPPLLLLAGLWALWQAPPPSPMVATTGVESAVATAVPAVVPVPTASLALGMSVEQVRALEGEPLLVRGDRWEYGPSWIRFEQQQVVDWHSSPLSALRSASTPQPR